MQATPKKLRNGTWGALVDSSMVREGNDITVTTKAGKNWRATVTRVLWTGDGKAIVATDSSGHHSGGSSRPSGRSCAECGRTGARTEVADSSGLVDVVCGRCARMSPYERSFA